MTRLRARVQGGRLVLDEATDLPEGTEIDLVPADGWDHLSHGDGKRLEEALARSEEDVRAGRLTPAQEVLARLRPRA